jgi:hypothetical protein
MIHFMILFDSFINPMFKCSARGKTLKRISHHIPWLKIRIFTFYKRVFIILLNIGKDLDKIKQHIAGVRKRFTQIEYLTPLL